MVQQHTGALSAAGEAAADLIDAVGALDDAGDKEAAAVALVGRVDAMIDAGTVGDVLRIVELTRAVAAVTKVCIEARIEGRAGSQQPRPSTRSVYP